MSAKIYMSNETWRTGDDQHKILREVFHVYGSDIPVYVDREDRAVMLRETTRRQDQTIFVASFAVLSSEREDVMEFAKECQKKKIDIESIEEKCRWHYGNSQNELADLWKIARTTGAAKIGAKVSADKKKAASAEGIAKIKDRWPQPSKDWPTKALLEEAGISLNTAKTYLGKRPIAQYNYQAKLKRKECRNAKR